jgi:thiamine kinase-like enzyme
VIQPTGSLSGKNWFAIKLPYLGHTAPSCVTLSAVVQLLSSWQTEQYQLLEEWPIMRDIIPQLQVNRELSGWHHQVGGLKLSKALVHGDFAMWNLRHTSNGLYAIDWEWADDKGVSGIDLVHALRQEAIMVRKLGHTAALKWMQNQIKSATWNAYLKAGGWDKHLTNLLRIGLLHSHFVANCDSGEMLRMLGVQV